MSAADFHKRSRALRRFVFSQNLLQPFEPVETEKASIVMTLQGWEINNLTIFSMHEFMSDLYMDANASVFPLAIGQTKDGKLAVLLECLETNDYRGYDLRNTLRSGEAAALLNKYGVVDIEFRNFPLPFRPWKIEPIKFHNAGNTPCP